jgi:flagellar biosynthesis/type III secretory pathway M-ring protein FliF/YscJ
METALVRAVTATSSGLAVPNLLILIALVAVAVPVMRKLRRSASEKRKRRWVEEGLMAPPTVDPGASEPSD